jgi:hypothetical protein
LQDKARVGSEDPERVGEPARSELEEQSSFDQLALASLAELWDNQADTAYDNWKELYFR